MFIVLKKSQFIFGIFALFVALTTLLMYIGLANTKNSVKPKFTIVIDAGHGGLDGGAVGKSGTLEKDINLKIAKKLQKIAEKDNVKVIMTRTSDISLENTDSKVVRTQKRSDLENRRNILKENSDCIFVSIHQNKFEQEKYKGAQVFYANNDSSRKLGEILQNEFITTLKDGNKRVAKCIDGGVYMLKDVQSTAVIVECGFLSNAFEEKLLNSSKYQTKVANIIYNGIKKYNCNAEDEK